MNVKYRESITRINDKETEIKSKNILKLKEVNNMLRIEKIKRMLENMGKSEIIRGTSKCARFFVCDTTDIVKEAKFMGLIR